MFGALAPCPPSHSQSFAKSGDFVVILVLPPCLARVSVINSVVLILFRVWLVCHCPCGVLFAADLAADVPPSFSGGLWPASRLCSRHLFTCCVYVNLARAYCVTEPNKSVFVSSLLRPCQQCPPSVWRCLDVANSGSYSLYICLCGRALYCS